MKYDYNNIKVLEEVEHVRQNPSMYIGNIENPVHIIEEAIDNSLDELMAGYGNILAVIIDTKNHIYQVIDNARGIPIDNDVPITICFKLFSGGKFDRNSYKISTGLHGIGLAACNFLSKRMVLEIYRDNRHAIFTFENQKVIEKKIENYDNKNRPFSTRIEICPDEEIFNNLIPDIERLRTRLYMASLHLPNSTFVLQVDGNKDIIKTNKDEFFTQVCLTKKDSELSPLIECNYRSGIEDIQLSLQYSKTGVTTPRVITSINLLPIESGTHVNLFYEMIRTLFQKLMKRYKKDFLPNDALIRLRAYLSLNLKYPKFSSQDKKALSNPKTELNKLFQGLSNELEKKLSDENISKYILNLIQEYRNSLSSKKINNGTSKRASVKFTSLRDCSSTNGELLIVEGESAAGGLIQCRDVSKHAILPLKGKVPNVINFSKILQHKEIGQMFSAIGTGVGSEFDLKKLRYNKIITLTDADPDGGHIVSLLIMILAKLTPELIKQGYVYCCETPLYAYVNGKKFKPLWTEEEIKEARQQNKLLRIKGLGELNPWQLKICVFGSERRLIKVNYAKTKEELSKLEELFISTKLKRDLINGKF